MSSHDKRIYLQSLSASFYINERNYQSKAGSIPLGQANLVDTSQWDIVPKLAHTY